MFSIQSDIPVPANGDAPNRGKPPTYPFGDMQVGDSFCVPLLMSDKVSHAAVKWKSRHPGWNYRTRKEGDVCRIWRTQ